MHSLVHKNNHLLDISEYVLFFEFRPVRRRLSCQKVHINLSVRKHPRENLETVFFMQISLVTMITLVQKGRLTSIYFMAAEG